MRIVEEIEKKLILLDHYRNSLFRDISGELIEFYNRYPSLLIIIIVSVPIIMALLSLIVRRLIVHLIPRLNRFKNKSGLNSNLIQFIVLYTSNLLYKDTFNSIAKKLNAFEEVLFIVSITLTSSLIVLLIFKIFAQNLNDQFNLILKRKNKKLVGRIFYSILFVMTVLQKILTSKEIGFEATPWLYIVTLIILNKITKSKIDTIKDISKTIYQIKNKYINNLFFSVAPIIPLILLIFIAGIYKVVYWLSYFQFTKKLSAKIIRYQVESVSKKRRDVEIPEQYNIAFKELNLRTYRPKWFNQLKNEINQTVNEWQADHKRSSFIHLIGDPGSGRRVLIKEILLSYQSLNPLVIDVDKKIVTKKQFIDFLEEKTTQFSSDSPKLIVFTNAENFFLNKPGDFEAIKEMFRIVNQSENDFFWINVFERYPWKHIEGIFGQVTHRNTLNLKKFTDQEIMQLIMNKNSELKTKILFDKALYETTSQNYNTEKNKDENVAKHYFQIIWEQSNGNPLIAQELWLKSIQSIDVKNNKIVIGLPERNDLSLLKNITIDMAFVYNSLVRHSRLNFQQCCEASSLSPRIVRFALVLGENEEFITKDEEEYFQISRQWYATVVQMLKTKNLLHE